MKPKAAAKEGPPYPRIARIEGEPTPIRPRPSGNIPPGPRPVDAGGIDAFPLTADEREVIECLRDFGVSPRRARKLLMDEYLAGKGGPAVEATPVARPVVS